MSKLKPLAAFGCWAVAAMVLLVGGGLIATNHEGGFMPDFQLHLGAGILAVGNGLSLLLNSSYWASFNRPGWLSGVIALQLFGVALTVGVLAWQSAT